MYCGLLTHDASEYFIKSSHKNFNLLKKSLGDITYQIHSTNKYKDEDISRIQFLGQIFDIFNLFKSMLRTRLTIVRHSGSLFFLFNIEQIGLIISHFLHSLCSFIFALLNHKFYTSFRMKLVRQSNISSGHINIMKQSLKSSKKFVLILEDDFLIEDIESINEMLKFIKSTNIANSKLQVINLSKSFSYQELGFRNFVKDTVVNTNFPSQSIDILKYPVTNTVCATLYNVDFLNKLIGELERIKMLSIIPIDHKINIALNKLIKNGIIDKECYGSSNPGIFIQGSLHG